MGNHEDLFLRFLDGRLSLPDFMANGGDATLLSYGLDPDDLQWCDRAALAAAVEDAIPKSHRAFLERLELRHESGGYFFCHAGVRPGVPLHRQAPHDLVWIREEFLSSTEDLGKIVVHGHTPVREPEIRVNGIDIDTKAFRSGVLTSLALEGTTRRFLQARG